MPFDLIVIIFDHRSFFCFCLFQTCSSLLCAFLYGTKPPKTYLIKTSKFTSNKTINIQDFVEMAEGHRPRWIDVLSRRQKESNKVRIKPYDSKSSISEVSGMYIRPLDGLDTESARFRDITKKIH